jgi:hypothetical protein
MISLRKLIMRPGSPDRAMEQAYYESEGALARIAHVNRLSRDIMDVKYYTLDMAGQVTGQLRIFSRKGIVKLVNFDAGGNEFSVSLENIEITPDPDKFYIQLTLHCNGIGVPTIFMTGFGADTIDLRIVNTTGAGNEWGDVYFNYDIIKTE